MSAEDYHDVPGFGGGFGTYKAKAYTCNFCKAPINFNQRKAFNKDGTPHRCRTADGALKAQEPQPADQQATLFAMAAMNAIINASIQSGGVDYIHSMNFYDVADASWRVAAAMVSKEQSFRDEYGSDFK